MSASTVASVGLGMKLYRNGGSWGAPNFSLIPNVADLKMDPGTADEVEVSTRGTGGFAQFEQGLKQASFEWDMRWKQSDADITAIMSAWTNGTLIELAFADGAIGTGGSVASGGQSGATYWHQECKIFSVARDEPLSGSVVLHVVAKPCTSANTPALVTVA